MISEFFRKNGYNVLADVILAAAVVFAVLNVFSVGLNDDTNLLFLGAVHLLRTHELYQHWVDISPPLIMLLYSVPAACVLWFNVAPSVALHGATVLLGIISLSMLDCALKRHKQDSYTRTVWRAAGAFVLFIAPQCYQVFADREHLFFIFALPWIIQMLMRLPPFAYTAIFAAIGFCIKPYNMALFVALTLFCGPEDWIWRRRIFSVSSWIIGSIAAAYLAIIAIFFPEYINTVVPVAVLTYYIIQETPYDKVINSISLITPAILLGICYIRGIRNKLSWVWLVMGAYVVYMLNGGWFYTRYLLQVPLLLVCFAVLYSQGSKWYKFTGTAAVFYFLIFTVYYSVLSLGNDMRFTADTGFAGNHNHMPGDLHDALEKAAGQNFILLSTALWGSNLERIDGYPHALLAYDYLWPLPWLYTHGGDEKALLVRQALLQSLQDALKQKPVLIVDESPYHRGLPQETNILAFFAQDKDIAGILSSFMRVDTIDKCSGTLQVACRFAIYRSL